LDFSTEAIFVSCREIFPPAEGDIGVPMSSEVGGEIADGRRKEREREIPNNFLKPKVIKNANP
jgi:hypothetical protein